MSVALDTSVLVAGLVRAHPAHHQAIPWLSPEQKRQRTVATHAIGECWATLTAMPLEPRITGEQAAAMLRRLLVGLRVTSLPKGAYMEAVARCASRGVRSGAIYDALHLIAAERAGAAELLTFNVKDFTRLALEGGPAIRSPNDFGG